jgi:uncharacterized protein
MARRLSPSQGIAGFLRPASAGGLPIFRKDYVHYSAFYAPGALCVVPRSDAERFGADLTTHRPATEGGGEQDGDWGRELLHRAEQAIKETTRRCEAAFRPECLTLYLNNECNLRCAYCYSAPSTGPAERLQQETISAAAEMVAENCRQKDIPFYVVFQGGGEPTLHSSYIRSTLSLVEAVALTHGLEMFRYVATNGVMSEKKAAWLARSFDLVGLSCDGPADIHDAQRPTWEGRGSLSILERTAHVLREEGQAFHVRVTITGRSLQRQAEVVEYLCQRLKPAEIHVEPLYIGGRADAGMALDILQAGEFVDHYLGARAIACQYGVELSSSGSRASELHGPFCNIFRQVLHLVPGGAASTISSTGLRPGPLDVATACFKSVDAARAQEQGTIVGRSDPRTGCMEIDYAQMQALRERLCVVPEECRTCFNRYHCAGDCPDGCLLDEGHRSAWGTGFRCHMQKKLTAALLEQTAERLWGEVLANRTEGLHGTALP